MRARWALPWDPALRAKFGGPSRNTSSTTLLRGAGNAGNHKLLGPPLPGRSRRQADLLSVNRAIDFYKAQHLDFSSILHAAEGDGCRFDPPLKRNLWTTTTGAACSDLKGLLEKGEKTELFRDVRNVDRTVGTGAIRRAGDGKFGLRAAWRRIRSRCTSPDARGRASGPFWRRAAFELAGEGSRATS